MKKKTVLTLERLWHNNVSHNYPEFYKEYIAEENRKKIEDRKGMVSFVYLIVSLLSVAFVCNAYPLNEIVGAFLLCVGAVIPLVGERMVRPRSSRVGGLFLAMYCNAVAMVVLMKNLLLNVKY